MDGLKKEAKITVVDEPRLKPITDENIGFYNMDINTAVLTFQVRKQDYPLEISKVNTDIYAYFVSDNGSSTGRVQVDYVNPMQGIIQLTLDNDFLKAATDTYVTGQIYIKAVGRKDTVVLNEFRFYVKDALINQIDADIKISYIREIDDLIDNFKKKIESVSQNFSDIETAQADFTAFVNAQKNTFIKQVNDMKNDMNTFANKTQQDLTDRLNSLDDKVLQTLRDLENGTENFVTEDELNTLLANYPTNEQLTTQLDSKANVGDVTNPQSVELPDFDTMIKEKVDEALANAQLQRFAFTDDNGYIPRIDNPDLYTMSGIDASGFYYAYNPVNSPDPNNQSGYLLVMARSNNYKKVLFFPFNRHKFYSRNMMGNTTGWGNWYDATNNINVGEMIADIDET
ncbi:BppU family phage baseplate upper protein [Staphylococcus hominis]|uniref:BppU family phage baseplate upper protein n=1 Tax=Staphylococcus hominis TaxID=1290 RepID=UPI0020692527|nr:BppU family phage baseplate upper protein [Staphylococcus hominis]MDH9921991.1 BppU family phage baseplate upper protein [Staphylococcus hominis]MDH9924058.1 BppU family phage baseplate upper protein [Staphylococcus hominis]MDH9949614.1 BppU family phage baseplate upper protein [Staphylococcus hominis]DAL39822.1 MAG TPA_asm: distal tail protein [Caudoviricetes sp.]